jgi:hypothetical protein
MRFLGWNLLFASWLLVSAFVFTHTAASMVLTLACALLVAVFALASRGKPRLRMVLSALAVILGGAALLMPGVSGAARLSNALVAALVFGLSVVPGRIDARQEAPAAPKA